jgi:hypothetical protein
MTDPFSRQRGRPTSTKPQLSNNNKNLVLGPRRDLTPRPAGLLTVDRNVTLTSTWSLEGKHINFIYLMVYLVSASFGLQVAVKPASV